MTGHDLQRSPRILTLALGLLLGACAAEPPQNLLFISLDTTRQDRLSLYGYERPTTPRIEALGRESAVFDNAFAQSTITTPSHTAMFTGLYPAAHALTPRSGSTVTALSPTSSLEQDFAPPLSSAVFRCG